MKRIAGVAVGTLALVLSGAGMAAGESNQSAVKAPNMSDAYKSSDLMNLEVQDQRNENLGKISELIVDKDGKVSYVVLREGGVAGLGGKEYIVPWDRLKLREHDQVAHIDVNKSAVSSEFAAFEENTPTAGTPMKKEESQENRSNMPSGESSNMREGSGSSDSNR